MVQSWVFEFLFGTGKLFLHPVFYLLFLLAAFLGVSRVKRERRNFHVRVENAYFELRQLIPYGFVIGLVISIVMIAVGVVIPFEAVALTAGITILVCLTARVRFLSPAYTTWDCFFYRAPGRLAKLETSLFFRDKLRRADVLQL